MNLDLRSYLFPPNSGAVGLDLVAINIQRGRDHVCISIRRALNNTTPISLPIYIYILMTECSFFLS